MSEQIKESTELSKKQLITNSAIELFSQNGFSATSTSSITKHAGVGTGTLFLYFKTKDDLILNVCETIRNELESSLKKVVDSKKSFQQNLRAVWLFSILWTKNHPKHFVVLQEASRLLDLKKIGMDEFLKEYGFFIHLVEQAKQKNAIRNLPTDFIINLYHAQMMATVQFVLSNPEESPEVFVHESFDILWNGIKI